jgi:hypothetical protein
MVAWMWGWQPPAAHDNPARMGVSRSPATILALTLAVGAGVWIGVRLVFDRAASGAQPLRPDLQIVGATPTELVTHGWRLTGREPTSWRDISVRLVQDDAGSLLAVRCQIAPEEAGRLTDFPPGAVRPSDGQPPASWPRAGFGPDPARFALPAWFAPSATQARVAEGGSEDLAIGLYANYDPTSQVLHLWQWERRDAPPPTPPAGGCDAAAVAIEAMLRRAAHPPDADGWLRAQGLTGPALHAACPDLPAAVVADVALSPWRGRHRYLMRLRGMDQASFAAWSGAARPMRPARTDPPVDVWATVLPPGGLPDWCVVSATDARAHCLVEIGPGTVSAGRWAAWGGEVGVVWDWAASEPLPAHADLWQ